MVVRAARQGRLARSAGAAYCGLSGGAESAWYLSHAVRSSRVRSSRPARSPRASVSSPARASTRRISVAISPSSLAGSAFSLASRRSAALNCASVARAQPPAWSASARSSLSVAGSPPTTWRSRLTRARSSLSGRELTGAGRACQIVSSAAEREGVADAHPIELVLLLESRLGDHAVHGQERFDSLLRLVERDRRRPLVAAERRVRRRVEAGPAVRRTLRKKSPQRAHRRAKRAVGLGHRIRDHAGKLGDMGELELQRRAFLEEHPQLL